MRRQPVDFLERETGFEPATLSLGTQIEPSAPSRSTSEASVSVGFSESSNSAATGRKRLVSALSSGILPAGSRTRLRAVNGGRDDLLSVREVAARLSVSTATVYALCARRELPHIRVLNAIRVAPLDLEAFIVSKGIGIGGHEP
ncbi:MAG: helix-turn-helix domain-containing protein [Isosphaeraceae bacterium]